jgi:pimeloyl-ACP methyl ester carboxylesterase
VRAVRALPQAQAGRRFAVWGHSQGGHAALYTGLQARRYASELDLVGVAAAAPATDLVSLLKDDIVSADGKSLAALALWSWTRVFDVPLTNVVKPQAMPAVDELAATCIETLADVLRGLYRELPLNRAFLSVPDITAIEPWRGLARANSPAVLPRDIPVFLAQGTADPVVRPAVTASYMARLCRAGSAVEMLPIHGGGHDLAGWDSAGAAVAWIRDRFDGRPAPSDCLGRRPGPASRAAFSNGRGVR